MSETTSIKRTLIGRVVSDKMDKTVTVLIERKVKHPMYGKVMVRSKKYHAHNDGNSAKAGDLVQIEETRPVSKTKAWRVTSVLEKAVIVRSKALAHYERGRYNPASFFLASRTRPGKNLQPVRVPRLTAVCGTSWS